MQKRHVAVWQQIPKVTAAIQAPPIWQADEVRLLGMVTQIATGHAVTEDADLTHLPIPNGSQVIIQYLDAVATHRPADGIAAILERGAVTDAVERRATGGLRGAVGVVNLRHPHEAVTVARAQDVPAAHVQTHALGKCGGPVYVGQQVGKTVHDGHLLPRDVVDETLGV